MMGLEAIREINRKATRDAKRDRKRPFVPTDAQRALLAEGKAGRGVSIPFLADHVPAGWETVGEPLFVDMSGFGGDDEPAMTQPKLFKRIAWSPKGNGWAMVEHGQFQAYVQEYRPIES
jgi:hypothetical protein